MDDERSEQVRSTLLKGLAVLAVVAVVIAIGTTIMVHALGLSSDGSGAPVGADSTVAPSPLPTTALPQPHESDTPTDQASDSSSPVPDGGSRNDIQLEVSPVIASPMERINLTGTYKGADNVQLQVQRYDNGTWSNFNAKTTVRVGTFATFIMTGRHGENHFRVFDPQTHKGSNVILVTVQ